MENGRTCWGCTHCDRINHAQTGSGFVELGCQRERRGYYVTVGSGHRAETCEHYEK